MDNFMANCVRIFLSRWRAPMTRHNKYEISKVIAKLQAERSLLNWTWELVFCSHSSSFVAVCIMAAKHSEMQRLQNSVLGGYTHKTSAFLAVGRNAASFMELHWALIRSATHLFKQAMCTAYARHKPQTESGKVGTEYTVCLSALHLCDYASRFDSLSHCSV